MDNKQCVDCKKFKPKTPDFFDICGDNRTSLQTRCKPCYLAYQRAYRRANRDHFNRKRRKLKPGEIIVDKRFLRWLPRTEEVSHKICGCCKIDKSIDKFKVKRKKKNGQLAYYFNCNECTKAKARKESQKKRDNLKAQNLSRLKPGFKRCTHCIMDKTSSLEFFEKSNNKTGLSSKCSECIKKLQKEKNDRKPKKIRPVPKEGYKFCNKCGLELLLNHFRSQGIGKYYSCKICELKWELEHPLGRIINKIKRGFYDFIVENPSDKGYLGCTPLELKKTLGRSISIRYDLGKSRQGLACRSLLPAK